MNGSECTKEIRRLEKENIITERMFIIAVTANARAEQVQSAMDCGVVSHDHLSRNEVLVAHHASGRCCLQAIQGL